MASRFPIVRQESILFSIFQLIVIGALFLLLKLFSAESSFLLALLIYCLLSIILKKGIPIYHRKGMKFVKNKEYELAIMQFEKSINYFLKYEWIDKYRFLFLLSASQISYLEMAMVNVAFCYGQIGNGAKSKQLYEETLKRFPESEIALTALRMYKSVEGLEI